MFLSTKPSQSTIQGLSENSNEPKALWRVLYGTLHRKKADLIFQLQICFYSTSGHATKPPETTQVSFTCFTEFSNYIKKMMSKSPTKSCIHDLCLLS